MEKIIYEQIPLDGVLDSPVDLRDYNYRDFCCSNIENNIPNEDEVIYPFVPRNQLNTSTCAFQSVTAIVETINDVNAYLSEGFLNAMRYKCDDVGTSKGAYTRDVMKLACKVGAIPKSDFPNLEDYPDIEESFNKLPNRKELISKGKELKCESYVRVDIDDIPNYIHNEKKPLIFTVKLYESFYDVNRPGTDGFIPFPSTGKRCGNHAMVCVGYKYINKQLYLKILNSWGKYWALNGYCWINAKDTDLINEVWGFTDLPKRKPGVNYKIGWDKKDDKWVYSEDGKSICKYSWKEINGKWYFLDKDGYALNNQWLLWNNKNYFLEKDTCAMKVNDWVFYNDNWYRVDNNGVMIHEWYQDINGDWYYLDIQYGYAYKDWVFIHGEWFYFDQNCKMQTGWLKYNNDTYFLETESNGHKGARYTNCTKQINGRYYTFDDKGIVK